MTSALLALVFGFGQKGLDLDGAQQPAFPKLVIANRVPDRTLESEVQKEYAKLAPHLWDIVDATPDPSRPVKVSLLNNAQGLTDKGGALSIGIRYGGFPKTRYGLDEQLCEATLLAQGIVFNEPIWGDAIGKYVCIDAVRRAGYAKEARADIVRRYRKGLKYDPKFLTANLAKSEGINPVLREAKGLWFVWQLSVRYSEDYAYNYQRAKRRLTKPGAPYTADDLVAVASDAAGFPQFDWFRGHGVAVAEGRTKIGK